MLKNIIVCSTAVLALVAVAAQAAEPFSFGVFGDTPYNGFERRHLPALIAKMDVEPLKVVIHDGDLKSGGERCDDALFDERLAVFQTSQHPFVFVPGDNDWTDCHRSSNGAYDPLERLGRLRQLFFANLGKPWAATRWPSKPRPTTRLFRVGPNTSAGRSARCCSLPSTYRAATIILARAARRATSSCSAVQPSKPGSPPPSRGPGRSGSKASW